MALICVSFYLKQNRAMTNAFKECAGLFWNDRFRPLFEAGLNLGGSILLVMWIGLPGVILGTIISTVLAPLWCEPYMVYKHYFKKNVLWYFVRYAIYSAVTVAAGAVTFFLCSLLPAYGFWSFIAKMAISIFGTLLIYFLAYFKTPEFKYIASSAKRLLLHKKKKVPAEKSSNGSLSLENKGSPVYGQTEKPEDDETSGGEKTKTTDGTKQQIPIEAIPDDTPYLTNTDAPDNEPSALPAPEEKDIGGG